MQRNLEILEHQLEFIEDTTTRFLALVGGYRSGKTYVLCIKALQLALANTELPGILCEPTGGMITRTLIPTMNSLLNKLHIPYNLNKSEGSYEIDFRDSYGPRKIWLLSSENYERAAGISASWFGMDEADLSKPEVAQASFNMLVSRLTRGEQMQGLAVSTPEGFGFMYNTWVENAGSDRRLIRASTRNNPFIDSSYFENMAKTHTSRQLEAYLEGYFVNLLTSNVYYAFDRELNNTDLTLNSWHSSYPISCGIDFNVNVMATAVGIVEHNKFYIVEELSGSKNTAALIKTIKERYPNRIIHVYPDCSGSADKSSASQSDIALLQQAGFKVFAKSKNPPVKDRISSVNSLFCNSNNERRCFVNIRQCPQITKGLEQQGYDKNGQPDKSSGLDHFMDSVGYPIHFLFPVTGKATATIY